MKVDAIRWTSYEGMRSIKWVVSDENGNLVHYVTGWGHKAIRMWGSKKGAEKFAAARS